MNIQKNMRPEVVEKILKNYQEILDAEINHPEDVMTFDNFEEFKKHMDSL